MKESKNRIAGIDIVKACAVLFVLCVHFSLNTNYYGSPIESETMVVQSGFRWLFLLGVPLFVLCTGFLDYKKTPSRAYYKKILRVIIPYFLISIICLFFRRMPTDPPLVLQESIFRLFDFQADTYSWYVNMYIGLFLLAPVFNAAVNSLERKQMKAVLFTLFFLISLPATANPILFLLPKIKYISFPNWWAAVYPVFYYLAGAYIGKYKVKINKFITGGVVLGMICLQTFIQIKMNKINFNNWLLTDYSSIFMMMESLGFFLLLYNVDFKNKPVRFILKWISNLTLEIYLFSNLSDFFIYTYFRKNYIDAVYPSLSQEIIFRKHFLPVVSMTFLWSLAMAIVFHILYSLAGKGIGLAVNKIKSGHNKNSNGSGSENDNTDNKQSEVEEKVLTAANNPEAEVKVTEEADESEAKEKVPAGK